MDVLIGASSAHTNLFSRHSLNSPCLRTKPAGLSLVHHVFNEMPSSETAAFRTNSGSGRNFTLRRDVGKMRLARKPNGLAVYHHLFDEMPLLDTFAWNNLIQSHLARGDLRHVAFTYEQMLTRGIPFDRRTIPRVLSAVSRLSGDVSTGKQLHAQAVKLGLSDDSYVTTALLEMYGRLISADVAKTLIHDKCRLKTPISWTLLIKLYIREGRPESAIETFHEMVNSGVNVDHVAMSTGISAAAASRSLKEGRSLHKIARDLGLESDTLVSNSLLKMYIDCGSISAARSTFDLTAAKDLISWTEIIQAYVKTGEYNEALKLFRSMVESGGAKPDPPAIATILPACARVAANKHGREIHAHFLRNRADLDQNLHVTNALIDMYAKSGSIESALRLFARLNPKDAISWTMMISGYSLHGEGDLGLELFQKLDKLKDAILIDQITYAAALQACVSTRDVEQGKSIFDRVKAPRLCHLVLMASLLSNAGLFDEAMRFAQERKVSKNPDVLRVILDGCRSNGNSKLAKRIVEELSEVEPLNVDNYIMLSNFYASHSKWDLVKEVKGMIGDMGLRPKKAFSWIELRNRVHVFGTGDVAHPRSAKIYWELENLMKKIEAINHNNDNKDYEFHCVDEERECIGIGHSEMLAISFGLISTGNGTAVRVTKNHRVCRFCHEAAKGISVVTGREIVLKDPNRFHHFRGGSCSCDDFW